MVNYVVYLIGCEFVEYRYCDCTIGQCSEECYCPVGAVASGKTYLVAFSDT